MKLTAHGGPSLLRLQGGGASGVPMRYAVGRLRAIRQPLSAAHPQGMMLTKCQRPSASLSHHPISILPYAPFGIPAFIRSRSESNHGQHGSPR